MAISFDGVLYAKVKRYPIVQTTFWALFGYASGMGFLEWRLQQQDIPIFPVSLALDLVLLYKVQVEIF